jgi:putative transposase
LSRDIVFLYDFISIEDLNLRGMTKSARGTKENPGKNVKSKSRQNRSMLDAGIGRLFTMITYKAEEAGADLVRVRPHGTSQRCSCCGQKVKKKLSDRVHKCGHCGYIKDRDVNAARNILLLGLEKSGRGPAECGGDWLQSPAKHETASMQALAA